MPFNPIGDLPNNPDARIFLVGQMILEPLIGARGCEVFVNRSAADHYFSMEVRKKKQNKPDELVMRHFGPVPFIPPPATAPPGVPPQNGIRIGVLPQLTPSVAAYNGANASTEGESLDLALNLKTIHQGVPTGPVEPVGGRPSIIIEQGTFYTADTYPAGSSLKKKTPGSVAMPLGRFAGVIGVNIYLTNPQQRVAITWRPDGREVVLRLDRAANQTHEIYISNDPIFQDDNVTAPFKHEEFSEYYKILPGVPKNEQFELITPPPSLGSLRTPCMSVLLST